MAPDQPRILAIDDDGHVLGILQRALAQQGYAVAAASTGEEGLARSAAEVFDLVLLDLRLPEMDGFDVLGRLRSQDPEAAVVIMTGHGSTESVVQAMKAGAADYLTKPLDLDHLEIVVGKALKERHQTRELRLLREQLTHQGSFEGLVGVSPGMQRVYELVRRVANSDTTVLIQGETGTGKELVARAIHRLGPRQSQAFMAINCGALPESILESELFGHEQGAFTGATKRKYGLIEQAQRGTLFLDEISEMSPALQVELLRAIQEREVLRVGGDQPIAVDFRLVAATNVDLRRYTEEGRFRPDLYYRLSVGVIDLPPLRQRAADIPLLAAYFLRRYAEKQDRPVPELAAEALQTLAAYPWPGNVRELENTMEQLVVMGQADPINVGDLPEQLKVATTGVKSGDLWLLPLRLAREEFERHYLVDVLRRAGGRVAEAARLAGMPRQYFYEKMRRHGISRE